MDRLVAISEGANSVKGTTAFVFIYVHNKQQDLLHTNKYMYTKIHT